MENIFAKQGLTSQELHLLDSEMGKKEKSTVAAWLLWLFLGVVGGHRYYIGRYPSAIIMTLTLGFFGIWALIDIFLINGMLRKENEKIEKEIIDKIQLISNAKKREETPQV